MSGHLSFDCRNPVVGVNPHCRVFHVTMTAGVSFRLKAAKYQSAAGERHRIAVRASRESDFDAMHTADLASAPLPQLGTAFSRAGQSFGTGAD